MKVAFLKQGNIKYLLSGELNSWAQSIERYVESGDTRVISGILMYANNVSPHSLRYDEVDWIPVDNGINWDLYKLKEWMNK